MLIRELFTQKLWEAKHKSPERGMVWESIENMLNQRSVRDRHTKLATKHQKRREEEISSGIPGNHTKMDDLEEI